MPKRTYQPTFIRQWRKHRNLSIERLADRIGITKASLSRIERGLQPYSQPLLEALADALMCEPADLIVRDPSDPDGLWSIIDSIPDIERPKAAAILKALVTNDKTGTSG